MRKEECVHLRLDISAMITVDGHRDYRAHCKDCEEELDAIFWLVAKMNKLLHEQSGSNRIY